jgi:hypothetical protein
MSSDRNHLYVTLLSNGKQKLYAANTLAAFTARLEQPIDMGSTDRWEVGVCEGTCHPGMVGTFTAIEVVSAKNALIYYDLISQQFVGSQYVRNLRIFIYPSMHCNHFFKNVYFMSVEKRRFQDIQIELLRLSGDRVAFTASSEPTKIVQHFRRLSAR